MQGYAEYANPPNTCAATVQDAELNKNTFVIATIRTLMAAFPAGLVLFSAFCVHYYPITRHKEVDLTSTRVRRTSISRHRAASAEALDLMMQATQDAPRPGIELGKLDETRPTNNSEAQAVVASATPAAASAEA